MAAPNTLPALLSSLTQSLESTLEVAPKLESIGRPKDGISLLDVKNELLLSYLQNLVFLILIKLRNSKSGDQDDAPSDLDEAVRAKLVELRLYLEKGARPLEEKLQFSIERFLRVAGDAQREETALANGSKKKVKHGESDEDSDSQSASDEEDEDEEDDEEDQVNGKLRTAPRKGGDLSAAPNFSNMVDDVTARTSQRDGDTSGLYRAPKRDRLVMETTTQRREKADRRPNRSHTMEEFVNSELSAAPLAEPSIGTTIVQGGRKTKTADERKEEDERREYEETNFIRLPKESKKERAKKNKQAGRNSRMMFGGEEWHNLGEGVERIDRLTRRKEGGGRGGGVRAMLEKSRKRGAETTDGPRGSGHGQQMGERFQKRVKLLDGGRRDRGKGR